MADNFEDVDEEFNEGWERIKHSTSETVDRVGDQAEAAGDQAARVVDNVWQTTKQGVQEVGEKVEDATSELTNEFEIAERNRRKSESALNEEEVTDFRPN